MELLTTGVEDPEKVGADSYLVANGTGMCMDMELVNADATGLEMS